MALIFSEMEIYTLDTIKMGNLTGMDSIFGQAAAAMSATLRMDLNMVKVNGSRRKEQSVILMKVNIIMM
jgi:hypothetical protein